MTSKSPYSSIPSRQGCDCAEPVGDPREGVCLYCGHQVRGYEIPDRGAFSTVTRDHSTFAKATRKFRPAA